MARETSKLAYEQIKSEGLLPKRRLETLTAIYEKAPCTRQEALASVDNFNPLSLSASRFTELRELGVIYEKSQRICTITKRTAIEWDLTDKLPLQPPKKITKEAKKKEVLKLVHELANITQSVIVRVKLREIYREIKKI
jgi:hypothetical protein